MTSTPVEPSVQHTPGPWRVVRRTEGSYEWGIAANDGYTLAIITVLREPAEANAALIAAAPECAERLSKAIAALRWIEANAEDTSERGWSPEYMKSVLHDMREQARLSAEEAEGWQA